MGKWVRRTIDPDDVMEIIETMGAPSLRELKFALRTDSKSVRMALGRLMAKDLIFAMNYQRGVVWMKVDGRRGRPSPAAARTSRGFTAKLGEIERQATREPLVGDRKTLKREHMREVRELTQQRERGEITPEFFMASVTALRDKYLDVLADDEDVSRDNRRNSEPKDEIVDLEW